MDWQTRALRLADQLAAAGKLRSAGWRRAVQEVPRHELVPVYFEYTSDGWKVCDTTTPEGQQRWLDRVYSNTALFTLPDGRSSSSMPGLMTRMLESLDVADGQRVLEIGTGSGYNVALLCHRLGEKNVFSVDTETELITRARGRLARLGYRPTLVVADGEQGLAEHAPYDRIIATCAVPAVPWSWVVQTRVDGLILTDLKLSPNAGNLVLLRRCDDRAEGHFDQQWGGFMPMRHAVSHSTPAYPRRDRSRAATGTTHLDLPQPWEHLEFWFFVHLELGVNGVNLDHGQTMNPTTKQPGDSFLASADGSWCEVSDQTDTTGGHPVWQAGPQRLWDAIEAAHQLWTGLGQPGWERFGLTVTETRQYVWLDDPDGDHAWTLPGE